MRATLLPILALLPFTLASNLGFSPLNTLLGRSTDCASGDIVCGSTCIPEDYTCCPDLAGGCSASETCQMGDNGEYGCCPEGDVCSGDGGATFIDTKSGDAEASATTTGGSGSATATSASNTNGMGKMEVKVSSVVVAVVAAAAVLL